MLFLQHPFRLPDYDETQILDLIVSKNLVRRQLNPGQRALMALEYERYYAEAAKRAQALAGKATAAKTAKLPNGEQTSPTLPADMREASEAPRHERESISRAARVVGASHRAVQQAKAVQRDASDLADMVRRGEIALDQADRERMRVVVDEVELHRPEPGAGVRRSSWASARRRSTAGLGLVVLLSRSPRSMTDFGPAP